ncbi:MAG: GPW/gp25 family protein, partial [Bacillota bacterium]
LDPQRSDLGTDLALSHGRTMLSALRLVAAGGDLATVSGWENLSQAIWLRLGVPQGDLAHLGHPGFGSRLHLLIGRLVTPQTLALAKAYVREALRREPRIAAITLLEVLPDPTLPGTLLVQLSVQPVGKADPIDLTLSFALEPGQVEAE